MFRQESGNNISPNLAATLQLQVLRNRLFAKYQSKPELVEYIAKISYDAGIYSKEPKSQATPADLPQEIQEFASDLKTLKSDLDDQQATQLAVRAQNTLR